MGSTPMRGSITVDNYIFHLSKIIRPTTCKYHETYMCFIPKAKSVHNIYSLKIQTKIILGSIDK